MSAKLAGKLRKDFPLVAAASSVAGIIQIGDNTNQRKFLLPCQLPLLLLLPLPLLQRRQHQRECRSILSFYQHIHPPLLFPI
jgi:hypothetical protein